MTCEQPSRSSPFAKGINVRLICKELIADPSELLMCNASFELLGVERHRSSLHRLERL